MDGIKNFLQLINDQWTNIIIIIGLCLGLYKKIKGYMNTSTEEKIALAKAQLKEVVLAWCSKAEITYAEYSKSGSIKRAEVIGEIFSQYPILIQVANQQELLAYIDELINNALKEIRDVVTTTK